ncbi:CsbD family protein [Antarcticirhabdus aurantiaca]|uniref:CsbD family protein n=1 Tax=Antarcticirhabdus aurantiaca TaxID=2606717 RepID=A0ACD4NRD8_9HYPH|nr:CsbD family protein [Antarcticirhabdus aurantiaca]WAJ29252.1 CsbD family protein [Jeongeuplla avenae]
MTSNPVSGLGKRMKGAAKELVAEITGDADLQDEGRRDIAAGRVESAGPTSGPRHGEAPKEPAR